MAAVKEKKVQGGLTLPWKQYTKLREYAAKQLRPLQECLAEAVDQWADKGERLGPDGRLRPRREGKTAEPCGVRVFSHKGRDEEGENRQVADGDGTES